MTISGQGAIYRRQRPVGGCESPDKIVVTTIALKVLYKTRASQIQKEQIQKEGRKMATKPTHEQAQLHLQVYDLRREPRLREARDWFQRNYHATTFEEAFRIAPPGTEHGAFVGMVIGYWEQACALLNYGLMHEDLFFETSGEFFGVWELLKPVVPEFREKFADPTLLTNLEKAVQRYEQWSERRSPGHIATIRKFMQEQRAQAASAAKA
jgi:hypothetical protein